MQRLNNITSRKLAYTEHRIHALLSARWSPVAFSDEMVEAEKIRTLLEAARWAASSYNEQPWHFIIATKDNPVEFENLLSCLAEGNQEWAKNAPVLMLSIAKLYFERNGAENRHAFHDVGAASAQMTIQATAEGLFIHQMAGFDVDKARKIYDIPDGYAPVAAMALGYLGDSTNLSEKLQQREYAERDRKSLENFVFSGKWNQVSPIL
ncbi:nitroreductase [Calothrix sp. NIES-4101]|nr:nitroreductase [Calothrix sp. NIES-4101]